MKKSLFKTREYVIVGIILLLLIIVGAFYFWKSQHKDKPTINITTDSTPVSAATITPVDPKIKEFGLEIDKLNILVPVIKNVDANDKPAYEQALKKGVAQFDGTALPGEPGNIFIFGHSSADIKSDYSKIFVGINDLEKNDEIILYYQNNEYKYKVKEKKIVKATNLSVAAKGDKEMLTLMTCWPIGTKAKRLIVIANPS
jgi:sortase A